METNPCIFLTGLDAAVAVTHSVDCGPSQVTTEREEKIGLEDEKNAISVKKIRYVSYWTQIERFKDHLSHWFADERLKVALNLLEQPTSNK